MEMNVLLPEVPTSQSSHLQRHYDYRYTIWPESVSELYRPTTQIILICTCGLVCTVLVYGH